jgi:hypothetical protein
LSLSCADLSDQQSIQAANHANKAANDTDYAVPCNKLVHLCKSAESNGLVKSSDAVVSAPNSDHLQRFLGCMHVYVALPGGPLLQLLPKTYFCATTWSFVERKDKPRRATDSIRFTLVGLSTWFDWRNALVGRQTRHVESLASHRFLSLLGMEIPAQRATLRSRPTTEADRRDGDEQIRPGVKNGSLTNSC